MVLLLAGGEALVRGAVSLANRLAVPTLIIGLTIVAFGTSAPELLISVQAALEGSSGIAMGNVVGSNIANVLLVLGVPALLKASKCNAEGFKSNIWVMIGITLIFMGMMAGGTITRSYGFMLLLILLGFLFWQFLRARASNGDVEIPEEAMEEPISASKTTLALILGIILLPLGANFTVDGAQGIAAGFGVSEEIIGVTVVALGTSLPELAASLVAVYRNSSGVALGNIVGSNIFNIAAIMGVTASIVPVPVSDHLFSFDMWVMLATALLLAAIPVFLTRIGFLAGLVLTSAYVSYVIATFQM